MKKLHKVFVRIYIGDTYYRQWPGIGLDQPVPSLRWGGITERITGRREYNSLAGQGHLIKEVE